MIKNAAEFYTGYIQLHKKGYWEDKTVDNSFPTSGARVAFIDSIPGVEQVVPRVESFALAAYGKKTKGCLVLGVDPEKEDFLTNVRDKLVKGNYFTGNQKGTIIAEGLAEYLKVGLEDTLILIGQGFHGASAAGLYPVLGIVHFPVPDQNNQTLYLSLGDAQWFYGLGNRLTALALVVDKAKNVDRIVRDISTREDTTAMEVMGWRKLMPDLVQGIEIDSISGQIMLWILYAVIGFGMFGTFLMMTAERMYEFGVMISVGMKRLKMQLIVFLEIGMMATLGVISGIGISLPILIYYFHHPIYFTGKSAEAIENFGVEPAYFFSLQPSLFYNQAWVIFFMALILAFYPIYVVHKLSPVEAMRNA